MKKIKTNRPLTANIYLEEGRHGNKKNVDLIPEMKSVKRKADTFEPPSSEDMSHRTRSYSKQLVAPAMRSKSKSLQAGSHDRTGNTVPHKLQAAAAEAYDKGSPFVSPLPEETAESATEILLFHGIGNEQCDKVSLGLIDSFDEENIFREAVLGVNDGEIESTEADVRRIILAALIHTGLLNIVDDPMVHHILRSMNEIDRATALSASLHYAIGLNLKVTQSLLDLGADPNRPANDDGWLPLESAIATGEAPYVKAILDKGGDPDILGGKGITPRQYAHAKKRLDFNLLMPLKKDI